MIATGGLLRISRRQDSLRAKNRAENKRRRKTRKKMKNNIVVVKGKLKLMSVSGFVAGFGVLVLIVGISMAVLGYWPRENAAAYPQIVPKVRLTVNLPQHSNKNSSNSTSNNKLWLRSRWNATEVLSNATRPEFRPVGLLEGLFNTYLYSDQLKVLGPLVMGIGIFLFICANAVLHENRDKKTKIIDLRDIYSTVIDIHSLRSKGRAPFNGLQNFMPSRDGELRSAMYNSTMPSRGSWPSTTSCKERDFMSTSEARKFSWSRERQSFTETIYSICKEKAGTDEPMPSPKEWETLSLVTSSVNAFTLPVIKLNNRDMEAKIEREGDGKTQCVSYEGWQPPLESSEATLGSAIQTTAEVSGVGVSTCQDFNILGEFSPTATCQQELLTPSAGFRNLGSHLSLNALSDLNTGQHEERSRRFSCPRLDRLGSRGYIKLASLGGDSFEASDGATETGSEGAEWTEHDVVNASQLPSVSLTQLHIETDLPCTKVDLDLRAKLPHEEQV